MTLAASHGPRGRMTIGHLPVDPVTMGEALDIVEKLLKGKGGAVFTPNVDHVVQAEDNPRFREVYARADLALVDGMPVVWACRLLGRSIPERVSGSDFVPRLLGRAADRGWRVYLFGGSPGVAALAREKLRESLPRLEVVGIDDSKIDTDDAAACRVVGERIAASKPDIVLVALGAPKQELFIDQVRSFLAPAVLVAIGGSLDFVAGVAQRAPRWMAQNGLEWLYRVAREPGRLASRYFLRDPRFAIVLGRELMAKRRPRYPSGSP